MKALRHRWKCAAGFAVLAASASASSYLCPRANVVFWNTTVGDANSEGVVRFSGTGGARLSFPARLEDIPERGTDWNDWGLELRPCSTQEFLCRRVVQTRRGAKDRLEYTLAVPRVVKPGESYAFEDLRIATHAVAEPRHPVDSPARVNVIISGGPAGQVRLTLEQSRGVIYWDAFRFEPGDPASGQLCALRLGTGFFADVEIRRP